MEITVIKPSKGWRLIDVKEIVRYRDLLYFLVLRGIKAKYAQSVLGVGWAILQPLAQTLVFTVIFGKLAGLGSDGVPYVLFSFVAMVPWNYFSNILSDSSNSLVANKNLLSKVYFPRIILPFSSVLTKLLDLIIGLVTLIFFFFYFGIWPQWTIIYFPLLLMIMIMSALGFGMILAALAIEYRDVNHAMGFMMRLLMYSAPVVYSIEIIPEKYRFLYSLNPMVGVIEGMRASFLGTREMPWDMLLTGSIVATVVFIVGALFFKKQEVKFADIT